MEPIALVVDDEPLVLALVSAILTEIEPRATSSS